jgi:imidazolonepropionase-like amidohydrolase
MKHASGVTIISNGQLLDGNGGPPLPDAAVVVRDGRIAYAGSVREAPPVDASAARIDAHGGTIMPGLVEAHFHATYFNVAALEDLDLKYPVEYVTLLAAAEIMGRGDEFGTLESGKWADVLVVAGDVAADIALLEDRTRFVAVMQGGLVKAGRALAAE